MLQQPVTPVLPPAHGTDLNAGMSTKPLPDQNQPTAAKATSGPCIYCSSPTTERCAGDFICQNCYAEAGACCSGE